MQYSFRHYSLAVWMFLNAFALHPLNAEETRASDLTAKDLAEVLSVHWWIIELPKDLKPNDEVGVEMISSEGKILDGGGGMSGSPTGFKFGKSVRVFCWEDKSSSFANASIKLKDGGVCTYHFEDYFSKGGVAGPGNGSIMQVGDILLKFDSSKNPSFGGGNFLKAGQVGLKVVVTRH